MSSAPKRRFGGWLPPGKRPRFPNSAEKKVSSKDLRKIRRQFRKKKESKKGEGIKALKQELEAIRKAKLIGQSAMENNQTSNIYVGNIPLDKTEDDLLEVFQCYGAVTSVKIMYPRNEQERARGTLHGFVNFQRRDDAEKVMTQLKNQPLWGVKLRLDWSNRAGRPSNNSNNNYHSQQNNNNFQAAANSYNKPVFHVTQYKYRDRERDNYRQYPNQYRSQHNKFKQHYRREMPPGWNNREVVIPQGHPKAYIKFPKDKTKQSLIDCLAEFVVKYGMKFEHVVICKEREYNTGHFNFLFHVDTPDHLFYRWRLWSLLQEDTLMDWSTQPFQMLQGGPFWIPPAKPKKLTSRFSPRTSPKSYKKEKRKMVPKKELKETERDFFYTKFKKIKTYKKINTFCFVFLYATC